MTEYTKTAREFLKKANATMKITQKEIVDRFPGDDRYTGYRWKYTVRINRAGKSYSFPFYDSVHNYQAGERPTCYDILACVEKFPVYGDVWDFAEEFGYTIDSREKYNKVNRIYKACDTQYKKLLRLFGSSLMEELQEIA